MDELVSTFDTRLVSEQQSTESNFKDRYKKTGLLDNQEQRRKELLEEQKLGRQRQVDSVRGIKELVNTNQDNIFNRTAHYKPSVYVSGFNKTSYRNILMMSEWMIEKPEDFNECWVMAPCPKGVRVLVIANKGKTKFFKKYGRFQFQVSTLLPGGYNGVRSGACTILDGVYDEKTHTLHVLDVLTWNNQSLTGCDAECRFFWLENKIKETPDFAEISEYNDIIISVLPKTECRLEDLNTALMKYPPFPDNHPQLDGFLFYHKHAQYVPGETPLVGWLYPYMIREVLGSDITIKPAYEVDKPLDYVNQADFIEKFTENRQQLITMQMNHARRYGQRRYSEKDGGDEMEADNAETTGDSEQMEAEVQQNVKEEVIEPAQVGFPNRRKERAYRRQLMRAAKRKAAAESRAMETGSGEPQDQSVESMESEQVSQEANPDTTQESMQDTTQESIKDTIQEPIQESIQDSIQQPAQEMTQADS